MTLPRTHRRILPDPALLRRLALAIGCCAVLAAQPVQAQPDHDRRGPDRIQRRPGPPDGPRLPADRWWDGAHGHAHAYPVPGYRVRVLPPRSRVVIYGGVRYGFLDGVWYAPGPQGYAVVRPPYGVVVPALPAFATVVTIGALSYWYANGTYYRSVPNGEGYEVVAPPVAGDPAAPAPKTFVYPRNGQGAQQQASDEYECHRWAVGQSGFDPTAAAVGSTTDASRRADYQRAQAACLDGRGYTVR